MANIFFTPVGLFAIAVVLAATGAAAYIIISRRPTKEVLLLRPRDKRGLTIPVALESDIGLTCKKTEGIVRRFLKAGPSWTFASKTKVVTRFLGLEGTAYTVAIKGNEMTQVSLEDTLRLLWGDKYNKLPEDLKDPIEKDKVGVTIGVQPIEEQEEMIPMSSDDLHDAGDGVVLEKLAAGAQPSKKMEIYQFIMGAIAGAFIMYLSVMQGWL